MPKLMQGLILVFAGGAIALAFTLRAAPGLPAAAHQAPLTEPVFSKDGQLQRPGNYRNWRFVTSGLGMSYGPTAKAAALTGKIMFDNVFVQPQAYDAFLRDGAWPEGTMFVLEIRSSDSQRPPSNKGYFQSDVRALEVSVKDSARFKGRWAYFDFGKEATSTSAQPQSSCFECHEQHTAVDMTFVQFYPTLQQVKYAQ